ncbi:hypothetical protein CMO91_05415 [Candidatus Woesearchaeota archaeon]|nr:hypothetical protein [Candidatus Woesearchaeota archaeon]|tara:strand:+ start:3227 stop:3502 length:276 start_codon:yes stop_codon:yes gene_type:complete
MRELPRQYHLANGELEQLNTAARNAGFFPLAPSDFFKETQYRTEDRTVVGSHSGLTGILRVRATDHQLQGVFAVMVASFYEKSVGKNTELA